MYPVSFDGSVGGRGTLIITIGSGRGGGGLLTTSGRTQEGECFLSFTSNKAGTKTITHKTTTTTIER